MIVTVVVERQNHLSLTVAKAITVQSSSVGIPFRLPAKERVAHVRALVRARVQAVAQLEDQALPLSKEHVILPVNRHLQRKEPFVPKILSVRHSVSRCVVDLSAMVSVSRPVQRLRVVDRLTQWAFDAAPLNVVSVRLKKSELVTHKEQALRLRQPSVAVSVARVVRRHIRKQSRVG